MSPKHFSGFLLVWTSLASSAALHLPVDEGGQGFIDIVSRITAFGIQTLRKLLYGVGLPWLDTVRFLLRTAGRNGHDQHVFSPRQRSWDLTGLTLFLPVRAQKIVTFERETDSTPRTRAFEEPLFENSFFPSQLLSSGTLRSEMRAAGCVKLGHVVKLYAASLMENPQIRSNKLAPKLREETSLPDFIRALAVPVRAGGGPPVEDCDWGQSYSQESGSNQVVFMQLDLGSLKSVRSFAENFLKTERRLDILINNAGLYMMGRTEDGFGMMFGVNHLGHFLLTSLLLDRLKECGPSRVVNVSSTAHNWGRVDFDCLNTHRDLRVGTSQIDGFGIYGDSKLCNVLFTHELAKRLKGTKVTCYSLHPGGIKTELARNAETSVQMSLSFFGRFFFKTPLQGSQTTLHCALQEGIEHLSGRYFSNCTARNVFAKARDDAASKKLWEISERFCGI